MMFSIFPMLIFHLYIFSWSVFCSCFKLGCLFAYYWVFRAQYVFGILVLWLICDLRIFSTNLWPVFSLSQCLSQSSTPPPPLPFTLLLLCPRYLACACTVREPQMPVEFMKTWVNGGPCWSLRRWLTGLRIASVRTTASFLWFSVLHVAFWSPFCRRCSPNSKKEVPRRVSMSKSVTEKAASIPSILSLGSGMLHAHYWVWSVLRD